jgi:hypothetical protein
MRPDAIWCDLVHNSAMASAAATKVSHRQTVSLPAATARRAKALARAKGVSTSRLLARLVEEGLELERSRENRFLELAHKFRATADPAQARKLGEQLGRMVFGG